MRKVLVDMWNWLYDGYVKFQSWVRLVDDFFYSKGHSAPCVASIQETIQYIIETNCSVARYGDGEMKLIMGNDISFQKFHPDLQKSLSKILRAQNPNLLVCIPNVFGSLDVFTEHDRSFWREYLSRSRRTWYKLLNMDGVYYDAFVSRCYLPYQDKSQAAECFQMWKQLWNGRDLLIIEGEKTRFGIGNDLFDNVRSIRRFLAPVTNAFERYDELLDAVKLYEKDALVLIALGPTATVLASDLSLAGYQAIDIGHLDIEYEWFLKKVDHKVPIEGKYVNEAGGFSGPEKNVDNNYQSQIVKVIG